jgi:hypothetical protein
MPVAIARFSAGSTRDGREEDRQAGCARACGDEDAYHHRERDRRARERHQRSAGGDQQDSACDHAAGAVTVGKHARDRLREPPHELRDAEREADRDEPDAGLRVDRPDEEPGRHADAEYDPADRGGGAEDEDVMAAGHG